MLESILVYYLTALIMYGLAKMASDQERALGHQIQFWCPEILLSIILFCFIAGARYNVGVDHLSYLSEYLRLQNGFSASREDIEPGFAFIRSLFAKSGAHYFFFFAFWAFLQIFFIYYALKDRKYLLPYVALSIMLMYSFFLSWMNGIRQCVVECGFVFLTKYIIDRKPVKYFIGVGLLYLIHHTALILIPLYLLTYNKLTFNKKNLNLAILFACVVIGSTPTWIDIIRNFQGLVTAMGYADYNIDNILSRDMQSTAFGPSRLSSFIVSLSIVWFYPKLKDFFVGDKYITLYFILFFIGACGYNLFANTTFLFIRPTEYFTIFTLPLFAYVLYYLKRTNKTTAFYGLCAIAFIQIFIFVYKAAYLPYDPVSQTYLYKFFFQ
jgi:hypothetical protein